MFSYIHGPSWAAHPGETALLELYADARIVSVPIASLDISCYLPSYQGSLGAYLHDPYGVITTKKNIDRDFIWRRALTLCSEKDSEPRWHYGESHSTAGNPEQHVLGSAKCRTYRHNRTTLPSPRHVFDLHHRYSCRLYCVDGSLGTICHRELDSRSNTRVGVYFRLFPRKCLIASSQATQ